MEAKIEFVMPNLQARYIFLPKQFDTLRRFLFNAIQGHFIKFSIKL